MPGLSEDWRIEARRIPIWRGAILIGLEEATSHNCAADVGTGGAVFLMPNQLLRREGDGFRLTGSAGMAADGPLHIAVDLSDPDTQAAYLRRLAIALGCLEGRAEDGVSFIQTGGGWMLLAGIVSAIPSAEGLAWMFAWTKTLDDIRDDDRLLALARAWPR